MPPQDRRFCKDKNLPKCLDASIEGIVQEYATLTVSEALSEAAANRMDEILTLAEADPRLNKLLSMIDESICHRQGLLDTVQQKRYRDALAYIKEFVAFDGFKDCSDEGTWQTERMCLRSRIDLLQS